VNLVSTFHEMLTSAPNGGLKVPRYRSQISK
jgi:hypothetical protein